MTDITAEEVRKRLRYDEETGLLHWVEPLSSRVKVGDPVISIRADGYIQVGICGRRFMAHRVIWLLVTGRWPNGILDHKDGVRTNNRWNNLREVSASGNSQNMRRAHRDTKHGLLGVSFIQNRKSKPFRSEIRVDGKPMRLGTFATPEEAHAAYLNAKRKFHPANTL